MTYNSLDVNAIMKIIDEKRLELNAVIERSDICSIPLSDEILQKSRELDELINIVQRKKLDNGAIEY